MTLLEMTPLLFSLADSQGQLDSRFLSLVSTAVRAERMVLYSL